MTKEIIWFIFWWSLPPNAIDNFIDLYYKLHMYWAITIIFFFLVILVSLDL